jgi:hypothetical protein
LPYAARKEVESSSEAAARFWDRAMEVKSSPLCTERLEGVEERWGREEERRRGGKLPDKPHEPFGRRVLFCFQLVEHEVLQRCGFSGCRELSVSYFLVSLSQLLGDEEGGSGYLDIAQHIALDGRECY